MRGQRAGPAETRRLIELIEHALDVAELTPGARDDLIAEMSGDVDDLYLLCRRRGDDDATALAKIEQRLIASPNALRELVALHRPLHVRLVDRMSGRERGGWEQWTPVAAVVPLLALAVRQLLVPGSFGTLALFGWLVLIVGLAAAATTLAAVRPRAPDDRRSPRLRSARTLVMGLAVAAPALALFGSAIGLYRAAGVLSSGDAVALPVLADWLATAGLLLTAGIACAFGIGFCWIALTSRMLRDGPAD